MAHPSDAGHHAHKSNPCSSTRRAKGAGDGASCVPRPLVFGDGEEGSWRKVTGPFRGKWVSAPNQSASPIKGAGTFKAARTPYVVTATSPTLGAWRVVTPFEPR